jgi:ABC-2 type transport system permease protein
MLIWALVSTSYGLAHVIFGNVRSLGQIVQGGELDLYLLQPKDVFLNVLASRTIVSAWGDFLYGFIVLAIVPGVGLDRFLLFSLLACSGAIIFAATFAWAESLCFFLGDASGISNAVTEFMLSFSLYPESIFGKGMRWIFYTILPSGFIAFLPLSALKSMDWRLAPALFGAAALYALASYGFFRLGLKRYESGNQMGSRI